MLKIFILSCWRSGTSWLEDILGKKVEGSTLFGHEQQILPLLSMYKQCFGKTSSEIKRQANKPLCDINKSEFHHQLGLKQHKILSNADKWTKEDFKSFGLRFIDFLLKPYEEKYKQVVEKSPENGSPEVFNCAIELLSDIKDIKLIYLVRKFKPYLASCFTKFIKNEKNDIDYYTTRWLEWNENAIQQIERIHPTNLFILSYEDLVSDPTVVEKFSVVRKKDIKIRPHTLNKWKDSPIIEEINKYYIENINRIKRIEKFVENNKIA